MCWFKERHVKDNEKGIKMIKNKLLLEVKSTFLNLGNNVIDPNIYSNPFFPLRSNYYFSKIHTYPNCFLK